MTKDYPPIIEVTKTGTVVGPVSYESAHRKDSNIPGIRHLTSNIFIFEDTTRRKLLLTRRAKCIEHGGVLNVCVGGHGVWLNEEGRAQTPLETAVRELDEVFYGVLIPPNFGLREVTSFPKDLHKNDPEYVHLFEGFYSGPFSLQPEEVAETYFKRTDKLLEELAINPLKYVRSANFFLGKYFQKIKP